MPDKKQWTRIDAGYKGCFGVWEHVSGIQVAHCGHPTALWPYYGVDNDGVMILTGWKNGRSGSKTFGTGFPRLAEAQDAIEELVAHPERRA